MLFSVSCVTERQVTRGVHPATQTLLSATKQELAQRIADFYDSIQSFDAEVEMAASTGSVYKGTIKDYSTTFTTFLAYRKPAEISLLALVPVVRTTAVQGVSDGKTFRVYMPSKSRFIEGVNDAPAASTKNFENLRPQDFLSAMLIRPVAEGELTTRIDDITEKQALYQMGIIRKVSENEIEVVRRITFDRVNLQIVEQREYDPEGAMVSYARYSGWQIYDNIRFPSRIEWSRPKDEFGVVITITKMSLNKPVPDARFVLVRPPGTELQTIGLPK
jgi:outer membrane lipoprotein-sorting protein